MSLVSDVSRLNKFVRGKSSSLRNFILSFFPKGFFSDSYTRGFLFGGIIINSIIWMAILIKIHGENKPIPLHFNAFYGIEFVGSGLLLFQLPAIGLVFIAVNLFLAGYFYRTEIFLSRVINCAGFAAQILLLAAAAGVLYLNR